MERETATQTCSKCRRTFRVLADEVGDHGCSNGCFDNEEEAEYMDVKLTQKQLIALWREEELEGPGGKLTVVEDGEWDGAGEKYQSLEVIFTDGERFFSGTITRSGSYFSDWNYDDYGNADISEVRKVTKTIVTEVWEAV